MEGTLYHPYQNLRVYQYASALASDLFWTTHRFPMEEPFGLTDQLRQTARTISLNVVQGWNKRYNGPAFRDHLHEAQSACARLGLWLDVSGERMQHGTTATMIFGVAYLVSYISRFMTLAPGDVVSTGTPAGVGLGRKPPRYLRPGDVMALGIDGLGVQRQEVVASA